MAQVTLTHLSKSYEKTSVIHDLSLNIADKEFMVLVGPSGCGKSTVLRMIAGLEPITAGTIQIGDRVVNDVAPKDRDIAMVFQSYALYPHMSVYDNLAFGLKMRKTPKVEIKTRVEEAARILDLNTLLTRKPKQLSGGQRQRVALGRAIVRNPHVFLMDEPLSNLDAKLRVQMRTEILKLHRRLDATTIYVTHDQVEAMTMGDRIVILNAGLVQQVGQPGTVYAEPANVFVGGFIGSMAFISLKYDSGQLYPKSGPAWSLPQAVKNALDAGNYHGKPILLGIRPEHFSTPISSVPLSSNEPHLKVIPELIEGLGHENRIHFMWENQALLASLPPDQALIEGQAIPLNLNLNKISYFDPTTQNNILFNATNV